MVANIGDGVNESSKAKQNMVVPSEPSQKEDGKNTKKTKKSSTPEEAADFLLSVLDEIKSAGLSVKGYNDKGRLILCIDGLNYSAGDIYPVNVQGQRIIQTKPVQSEGAGVT
jgi:hypothetical protein